ncbi:ELWxxDGT repeat protein [Archangium gephyra]|uniref:ELWxxDGT repeat protein n=1 Tax=Archangium gephyra TaxID=48 RepID=A0AAC8QB76_9BACT|nr:ELWxxDGT repeat protein [Archangium gephyra]AKJ04465.1 Flagellar hook-length control protein FliK [Archangium gephyra]REG37464.1 ELWxxDGT repeat protein [Archangium gephyra]
MTRKPRRLPLVLLALGLIHCGEPPAAPVEDEALGEAPRSLGATRQATCVPAVRVGEFTPGRVSDLTDVEGTLFFTVDNALWKSDATPEGTVLVRDFSPDEAGGGPRDLTEARGLLFFVSGGTLWRSDGTEAGTFPLVTSTLPGFDPHITPLREYRGRLFFRMIAPGLGEELWSSDGTRAGTRLVADINPGPPSSTLFESVVTASGDFVFGAHLGEDEEEVVLLKLTRTGRLEELFRVRASETSIFSLTAVGDRLFFLIDPGDRGEASLYTSDGTPGGASLVKFFGRASTPRAFTAFDGRLFFVAEPEEEGDFFSMELWVSDGTPGGTHLFADIRPGLEGALPTGLTVFEGLLYFSADDGVHGRELWATDGTVEGTRLVQDIRPGTDGSGPYGLRSANRKLYFVADDGLHGAEPWKVYQGRARLVTELVPGPVGSAPRVMGFDPDEEEVFFRSDGYVFFETGEDVGSLWAMKTGAYCPPR